MKKVVLICLFLSFISCKSQEKKVDDFINVKVVEFQQLISKKNTQLVDVRTPNEYEKAHIKNAILINFFDKDFKEQSSKKLNKNKPVYLYCRSGGRSAKAAKIYKEAGFTKVYNLIGGFKSWSTKNK